MTFKHKPHSLMELYKSGNRMDPMEQVAEMLNVSTDILALAAVRLIGAEELSSFWNKGFWMETQVFLVGLSKGICVESLLGKAQKAAGRQKLCGWKCICFPPGG